MPNKINLITGETYNLSELFSGNRRIIIPDLQRDYCWGNIDSKIGPISLAEGFIDTLIRQFEEHPYGKLNLGLLYGYECPSDYVQLCDGQQRITTLFLLLGMLNRWSGDDSYRHYLITDFEFHEDDHEPYLQYSIRESSLYFLSDLVYHFFTNGGSDQFDSVGDIFDHAKNSSCSWFYGEYVTDPSIMSMLRCLSTIENKKEEILSENDPARLEKFVEFLVDRLTFIYYDMGSRANGEETFVVINTTGEPLTATENLKPLVVSAKINEPFSDKKLIVNHKSLSLPEVWEEMENFFWRNRNASKFDTADNGFNEFLRWVTLLKTYNSADQELFKELAKEDAAFRFPYNEISILEIVEIYETFQKFLNRYIRIIPDNKPIIGDGEKLLQKDLFVFLPLLAYLHSHPHEDPRQLRRLWEFLRNIIRIDNVLKSVNGVLSDAIRIGYTIDDPLELLNLRSSISSTILTDEEIFKLKILNQCPNKSFRISLEKDIWRAQNMEIGEERQPMFFGEIAILLRWATPDCTLDLVSFDACRFHHYLNALRQLINVGDNDLTRRALLAWGYKGFPYGNSYGFDGTKNRRRNYKSTWNYIISAYPAEFRRFMNEYLKRGLKDILRLGARNPIVMYPGILRYSNQKNLCVWNLSGLNACRNDYAEPIPISLAVIMARLGAEIRLGLQDCNGFKFNYFPYWLNMTKAGKLEFTPKDNASKQINKIIVSAVDKGEKLSFEVDATPNYNYTITLPLSSADDLIEKLLSLPKRRKNISKAKLTDRRQKGTYRKKLHSGQFHRKTLKLFKRHM